MEENVALDSSKQKKFVKSLTGIKKLIKKTKTEEENTEHVPLVLAPKKRVKKNQSKRKPKGLVYLSHIPHGFFEHQMTEYFKQFGGVTNVRVIRSKRTGNSRGCAFVEFKEPAVAEIVAETMNNYLMGKRIIKAAIIPPDKQRRARRMQWSSTNNPGFLLKKKIKKDFNTNKGDAGDLKRARNIVANLLKTKNKLNAMGIQFDFAPVDVPEELQDNVKQLISNAEDVKEKKQEEKPSKKEKKDKVEDKKESSISVNKKTNILEKNNIAKVENKASKETKKITNLKNGKTVENNKAANKKLKEKGVIPLDSFIKIQSDEDVSDEDSSDEEISDEEGSGEETSADENEESGKEQSGEESDDSALEFDDEAYDKMAESSESLLTDEEEDSEGIDESESDEEEPPIITKKNKNKGELKPIAPTIQKKTENKKVQLFKRKAAQKVEISSKKPKFEKKNDKKLKKKQFKVK